MASISEILFMFHCFMVFISIGIILFFMTTSEVYRNKIWISLSDVLSGIVALHATMFFIFLTMNSYKPNLNKFDKLVNISVIITISIPVLWLLYVKYRNHST